MLEEKRILMVDHATAWAQALGVAPTISREGGGGSTTPLPGLARTWPQWPCSWTRYSHPPPPRWISCTTSWGVNPWLGPLQGRLAEDSRGTLHGRDAFLTDLGFVPGPTMATRSVHRTLGMPPCLLGGHGCIARTPCAEPTPGWTW
jgi:hypothetical protein